MVLNSHHPYKKHSSNLAFLSWLSGKTFAMRGRISFPANLLPTTQNQTIAVPWNCTSLDSLQGSALGHRFVMGWPTFTKVGRQFLSLVCVCTALLELLLSFLPLMGQQAKPMAKCFVGQYSMRPTKAQGPFARHWHGRPFPHN